MTTLRQPMNDLIDHFHMGDDNAIAETSLPGVRVFHSTVPLPREPLVYGSSIIIIGQGRKSLYLGDLSFQYDENNYLVVGLPLAFECSTEASPENPLTGLIVDLDTSLLLELINKVDDPVVSNTTTKLGAEPVAMSDHMQDVVGRLTACLLSPVDTSVLGAGLVRELHYRALNDRHGSVLRMLSNQGNPSARIARVLQKLSGNLAGKYSVDQLAKEIGMSSSAFYRAFRSTTGETPVQYLKKLRLNHARSLILYEGKRANEAATLVGYESLSQFSRDFKVHFGTTTAKARESIAR
ncbi:transcriptional regulator, AraC family [Pseudovibrio denitrificans]|uniref:Transcriptional regulator, AraC family n=1 Tax=Pseudovibrio denitrificans TaxID=258256 RepID=A0A1I7CRM3_9HYPH|nr:AraC family transcriptional regulator [Pseudovibrio denitrificans]SFU02033.1 transcriptional regulator, AraC family [Pseudovibrio denitrificans]